jgi:glycosyltransferase involved in cell wall biosynthesis
MRIILIGNYPPDGQESMERYASMLNLGFQNAGIQSEIWRPTVFFGTVFKTTRGLGKWIGYIDKWILFPIILWWRLRKKFNNSSVRFHICDHSNAPYLKYLPVDRTIITCHDALAIRGAFGYDDAYCPATPAGKILQKWILQGLLKAGTLVASAQLTLDQLDELSNGKSINKKNWHVIPLAFNDNFTRMEKQQINRLLTQAGIIPAVPFLLHVGSALPRKNRKMLIDMVAIMGDNWDGKIYFAGEAADDELMRRALSKGLQDRVVSLVKPNHETLVALYSACEAFVFPSFSEGFGWPIMEAQACGAPVIASSLAPLPEVSGGAALHAHPTKPEEFAAAFLSLKKDEKLRNQVIQKGLENITRFKPDRIINSYLALHGFKQN